MVLLLALVFLVVPIIELAVIIRVGSDIGALNTIGLLVLMSVAGGWLMRREGIGILQRIQASLAAGGVPGSELVDGVLILFAGALLLTPGFLTDLVGMSLLLPPVRAIVRRILARRFRARVLPGSGFIDVP